MAMTKTDELRKKAQALLAQAKKIEEESTTRLGASAAKFLAGDMNLEEFEKKGRELGFEIRPREVTPSFLDTNGFNEDGDIA